MRMRVLGVAAQLALLVFAVAMRFEALAVVAAALFVWHGTCLVYELLSGQTLPGATDWMTAKVSAIAMSDGTWVVAAGIGSVVLVGAGLIAVADVGRPGHYVGAFVVWLTAWVLGTMRRVRQRALPQD
jgi:hypothetical protein